MQAVILVPAYQCEATIAETLKSILDQGEALDRVAAVYVADDASTDRTCEVARESWTASTPLHILRSEKNRGEYVNVNEAVLAFPPGTDWFLIMHADNAAKSGWLTALLDRAGRTGERVGMIGSSWDDWSEDGSIRPGEQGRAEDVVPVPGGREQVRGTLRTGCWWHISSTAIRVAAFKAVGGLPRGLRLKGDWDYMLRIQAAGWGIDYLPVSLMKYRTNPLGSSSLTFRLHSDIAEMLRVIQWHRGALTASDVLSIHTRYFGYMTRRCTRAAIGGDGRRFLWSFPAMGRIMGSCVQCLAAGLRRPPLRAAIPYNGDANRSLAEPPNGPSVSSVTATG